MGIQQVAWRRAAPHLVRFQVAYFAIYGTLVRTYTRRWRRSESEQFGMLGSPLSGLRVVSFEHFGAAPYATMFLADLGAEVLKAETSEGDFARRTGPLTLGENDSLYFQCFNMRKKGVVLDLSTQDGVEFFHELVADSQIVVNNLRGHLPDKLGLTYAALRSFNPAIVCGHISAYGRRGPRASWPGFDFLMQAEAGLMALNGEPGKEPTRIGASMIDYMTGMMLALGIVSAVRAAEATGEGGDVDISLFDAALHQLAYQAAWYLNEGIETSGLPRAAHPTTTPVQLFRTANGWIFVACMNEKFWQLLTGLLDAPALRADPRFADVEQRLVHRAALTDALDDIFATADTNHWMARLQGKVPAAPVNDLAAALDNPYVVREAEMIQEIAHPTGTLRMLANPLRIDGRRLPQEPAPRLGEHTQAARDMVLRR